MGQRVVGKIQKGLDWTVVYHIMLQDKTNTDQAQIDLRGRITLFNFLLSERKITLDVF